MQQQRCLPRFLQRRLKGGDQVVRKMPDKPYGIRQHRIANVRDVDAPQRGIQRGKQLIRRVNLGGCHTVEQGGFAGVGIADQ